MPTYRYAALDKKGTKVKGEVNSATESAARKAVRDKGLFVVKMGIDTGRFRLANLFGESNVSSMRVPQKELVFLTRQMATLLRAGFTLDSTLNVITEQISHPGLNEAILEIDKSVKEGMPLHEAMGKYPNVFKDIFRSLVKAGEASGELPMILGKLAQHLEEQAKLRNKLFATLTYPLIMILASFIVVGVLMTYVVPNITSVLVAQKKELPMATSILIEGSNFLSNWWIVLVGGFAGLLILLKQYYRTKGGKRLIDGIVLSMPILGNLFTKVAISRFASTLAILIRSGVEILKSLNIVKDVVGNVVLATAIQEASRNLGEGNSLAEPLKDSGVFPPIVIKMIDSGQRSGNLEMMLETIAGDYDNEVENTILGLTSILEPIIILVMGGFVCFIVVAILVPLQDMANL